MADQQGPSKNDIGAIFKRLRSGASNKACFDCDSKNPTWASVTYGVFICIDCSAVHRSLGVHVTFVRSTQLDTNWTWLQLRAMQVGGNANAKTYFSQHNCTSSDAQQKYNSRAAQLYKEKLHNSAVSAMKLHGNKLHIDALHGDSMDQALNTPDKKEVDFFEQISESMSVNVASDVTEDGVTGVPIKNGASKDLLDGAGPNVEMALGSSPSESAKIAESRKPTIGQRRQPTNKKGMGAKKSGGFGAQKVSTNFTEIEKEAQLADQAKEKSATEEKVPTKASKDTEAQQMASIRLAYQDISLQQKKEEDKLKQSDPKKASQLERLGMGFGGKGQVSHSATSEMKTIEQENPNKGSASNYPRRERDLFEDEFELVGFTSSGPPKYNDSPFTKDDRFSAYGSRNEDKYGYGVTKSSSWESDKKSSYLDDKSKSKDYDDSHGRSRKAPVPQSETTDEAVKKFGNAKSISSQQFFGGGVDGDYERRTNLSRFEGSTSISSSDYFGDSSSTSNRNKGGGASSGPTYAGPDLEEIRDGVRAGVTKVAGKISSLANGMMNSLQDRYGY